MANTDLSFKTPVNKLIQEYLPLLSFDPEETLDQNLTRLKGPNWTGKLRDFITYQKSVLIDENPGITEMPEEIILKDLNILHDLLLCIEYKEVA